MADDLDTAAVLSATDRLLRTLPGPFGGTATWEWSDLLAAATGRSPFDLTGLVRTVAPQVPDPANAGPAEVAAQLVRLAGALDGPDRDRVRRVARLLDPDIDLDADPRAAGPTAAPTSPPVGTRPEPVPSEPHTGPGWQPTPSPQPPPPPAGQAWPQPAAEAQRPPAYEPRPSPSQPSAAPGPSPVPPPARRAKAKKRNWPAVIWIAIVAFFVLRGCLEEVLSRGG